MSELPEIGDAFTPGQPPDHEASDRGALIPWLPTPPDCPECSQRLTAGVSYHPGEAAYIASWVCEPCELAWEREPVYGDSLREGPSEGADWGGVFE